jgi:hypothetical protein
MNRGQVYSLRFEEAKVFVIGRPCMNGARRQVSILTISAGL